MRRLATALALALLLAAPAATVRPAPALASDAGVRFFEAELEKMSKGVADKLFDIAEQARKGNLFAFARREANRALQFDPDQKKARDMLGFVKKRKEWVLDEGKAKRLGIQNTKGGKEGQTSFNKKIERWNEKLAKVNEYIAARYAQLGNACRDQGHDDQAQKAYERAILIDPNQESARKGLGHRKVGKRWLTEKQIDAIKRSIGGEPITETGEYEKGIGVALNGVESPHFRLFDDARKEALGESMKALETLYVYFLADVGTDPTTDVFDGKKVDLVVVSKKGTWDVWVDKFSNSSDPEWTKGSTTSRSYILMRGGVFRVATAEDVDTRDPLLHHAGHFLSHAVWNARPHAWLDEGLTYYYTVKVQNTTRTSCLARPTHEYGIEDAGGTIEWTVSERWREYLVQMVSSKADTPLRKLIKTPLATLELPDGVKAWAVVSWLMDHHRDEFISFLKLVKEDRELDQEAALQKIFKMGGREARRRVAGLRAQGLLVPRSARVSRGALIAGAIGVIMVLAIAVLAAFWLFGSGPLAEWSLVDTGTPDDSVVMRGDPSTLAAADEVAADAVSFLLMGVHDGDAVAIKEARAFAGRDVDDATLESWISGARERLVEDPGPVEATVVRSALDMGRDGAARARCEVGVRAGDGVVRATVVLTHPPGTMGSYEEWTVLTIDWE